MIDGSGNSKLLPLDVIARVPLAPVLAIQGVAVRRKARCLPEPPGARVGVAGAGPALRLLIAGDSSAAGVGARSQEEALSGRLVEHLAPHYRIDWQLEAKTGATTAATTERLLAKAPGRFDVAVLALGVNDVTRAVPVRRWKRQQRALWTLLQEKYGVRHIFVTGLPPMGLFPLLPFPLRWVLGSQADRFDRALAELAAGGSPVRHVPVVFPRDPRYAAEDGYHPSPAAYSEWGRLMAGLIVSTMAARGEG